MTQLVDCCGHGPGTEADIYASMSPDEEPKIGDVYGVPKHLSSSGLAELMSYRFTDTRGIGESCPPCTSECKHRPDDPGVTHFWSLFLKSIPKSPGDPCDSEFMEGIST